MMPRTIEEMEEILLREHAERHDWLFERVSGIKGLTTGYVEIPWFPEIGGMVKIRWNVEEQRFDQLISTFNTKKHITEIPK